MNRIPTTALKIGAVAAACILIGGGIVKYFGTAFAATKVAAVQSGEQTTPTEAEATAADPAEHSAAPVDKQSEAYIRRRVEQAYAYEGDDREAKFTSRAYFALWQRVAEKDAALEGEIGFFDANHWLQAQDADEPKIEVVSVTKSAATRAKVVVKITDFGTAVRITFPMIFERGDWFIDDFITDVDGREDSEKARMKQYVAS